MTILLTNPQTHSTILFKWNRKLRRWINSEGTALRSIHSIRRMAASFGMTVETIREF